MNDAILGSTDREEALSRAYVAAVAAGAGYTLAVQDFDRDGVDVQVRAGGAMRPSLDIQLKATVRLKRGKRANTATRSNAEITTCFERNRLFQEFLSYSIFQQKNTNGLAYLLTSL